MRKYSKSDFDGEEEIEMTEGKCFVYQDIFNNVKVKNIKIIITFFFKKLFIILQFDTIYFITKQKIFYR